MIYTLTLNPAIDFVTFTDKITVGNIHTSVSDSVVIGGKGINVSFCLKELGVSSVALGFVAGFTGEKIEQELSLNGIKTDFVKLNNGYSRINIKIRDGNETDINSKGPKIEKGDLEKLYLKLENLNKNDILVLAGSIPLGVEKNIYAEITERVKQKGVKTVIDAEGEILTNAIAHNPFLIKPNREELENIFNTKINSTEQAVSLAKKLQTLGAENVAVSLGGDGAFVLTKKGDVFIKNAPKGKVVNTVGAGDSTVAGIIAGYLKTENFNYAVTLGVACGSATAFSTGVATQTEISNIFSKVKKL